MTQPASPGSLGTVCAACGSPIAGRYCSHCGAAADPGNCGACNARLSPGARFCHHCGAPVSGKSSGRSRERLAWMVAGSAGVLALLLLLWRSGSFRPTAPPEMGNAGNTGVAGSSSGLTGRAPDISALSPAERFARLFDRVERAASNGDTVTVVQFAPMALGAYALLDSVTTDERFHAALIHLTVGNLAAAEALADTMLRGSPGHLFGYVVRGEVGERGNRQDLLLQSYRDFLAHYQLELRSGRPEYAEHQPILDDFRIRAQANGKP